MPFDYAGTAAEVRAELIEAGALCPLSWTPPPESDAPDAIAPPPVAASAYGAVFEYDPSAPGVQADALIRAGDRQLLLAVFDETTGGDLAEPPHGARIVAPDGVEYTVERCKPLAPAGVPVLFDITLRR